MEKTIELLENLNSSDPTDLFVYLDILNDLKYVLHKIDVSVRITENVYIDEKFRGRGSAQYPVEISQPDNLNPIGNYRKS
jgi:hypothetical protein